MNGETRAEDPAIVLADLEARSGRFETPCGEGVMVWHGWGQGPVLVLLHGGNGSWRQWVRTIPVLSRSYHVLAADLPGLGDSMSAPESPTAQSIARIVADGIDALIGTEMRYDIAGFSFGAMIGSIVAALHGERVRSLTVNGPGGMGGRARTLELVSVRHKTGVERLEGHRTNLAALMIHDPAKIDALALATQEWHSVRNRLRTPLLSRSLATVEALAHVRARVGAIYGEFDAPAYPDISKREAMLRAVRPDLDFRVIPHAGHWTAFECPEPFNAMLLDMLRRNGRAES